MCITKVALAGVSYLPHYCIWFVSDVNLSNVLQATGNLGPAVLKELLSAGFEVTVLSRSTNHNLGDRVRVAQVDYSSIESLKTALLGQDALVITLGHIGLEPHMNLVNAAVSANVKRIIPSEFGSDTTNPNAAASPVFADKVAIQKHLKEVTNTNTTTSYTLVINGPFFDWGLQAKFLVDLTSPTPEIYDGGNRKFSTTTLAGVGQAIAGVLKNLDATRNKAVFVESAEVSQKELLAIAGKQVSPQDVSTKDLEKAAFSELQKPAPNGRLIAFNFLKRVIFGEGCGSQFSANKLSNDLLGVHKLSEAEIRDIVSRHV